MLNWPAANAYPSPSSPRQVDQKVEESGVSGTIRWITATRAGTPSGSSGLLACSTRRAHDATTSTSPSWTRIASISSVTSMPTGHHVMHRPQPTHPDVPYWSIHDANLCVSHCR